MVLAVVLMAVILLVNVLTKNVPLSALISFGLMLLAMTIPTMCSSHPTYGWGEVWRWARQIEELTNGYFMSLRR